MKESEYHNRLADLRLSDYELNLLNQAIEYSMRRTNLIKCIRHDPLVSGAIDCLNNLYRFISGYGESHDIFSDEDDLNLTEIESAKKLDIAIFSRYLDDRVGIMRDAIEPLIVAINSISKVKKDLFVGIVSDLAISHKALFLKETICSRDSNDTYLISRASYCFVSKIIMDS